jgi:soluble lytic murein transglycosylase
MKRCIKFFLVVGFLLSLIAVGVGYAWLNYEFEKNRRYNALIEEAAEKYNLDPLLIRAVIWRESGFNPRAHGRADERGLMQVTPGAAEDWAKAEKVENFRVTDLFDPRTNITAGSWYLSRALGRWTESDQPVVFALAEYNAGRKHARRWAAPLPDLRGEDFLDQMDFPTTRAYIRAITEQQQHYEEKPDEDLWDFLWNKIETKYWRWRMGM